MKNRRNYPRIKEDLKVRITLLASPEDESLTGREFECHTKDISIQGMCVFSRVDMYPGTKLEMHIGAGQPAFSFSFTGIVIWCRFNDEKREYEIGIQIMNPEEISFQWKSLVLDLLTKAEID